MVRSLLRTIIRLSVLLFALLLGLGSLAWIVVVRGILEWFPLPFLLVAVILIWATMRGDILGD
jgi:hypothetical protein